MTSFISAVVYLACAAPVDGAGDGGAAGDGGTAGDGGVGTADGGMSDVPCVETEAPLSEVEVPVDLAEVWPVIEAWSPSAITWENSPIEGAEGTASSLSISFEQAGDPVAVTRTGGDVEVCRPGPELRIPVTLSWVVDGGSIESAFVGTVDAAGTELPLIYFLMVDWAPAISETWTEAAEASLEERGHELDGALVVSYLHSTTKLDAWEPIWLLFAADSYKNGYFLGWQSGLWKGYPDP